MRTDEQINKIRARIIDPYVVENFLSESDINDLVELYESGANLEEKVNKNTGPTTLDLGNFLDHEVVEKILHRIEQHIGPFEVTASFFFQARYPHIVHNDDTFLLPDTVYRGITIPLKIYSSKEIPKLCFFDQFYFHGPAKFFKGETSVPTYYNECVYDYSLVDGLVDTKINREGILTHLKPQWLEGLSLHSALPWKPTSAIIFDSVRLHCGSDFRQQGISSKLGISVFTKIAQ